MVNFCIGKYGFKCSCVCLKITSTRRKDSIYTADFARTVGSVFIAGGISHFGGVYGVVGLSIVFYFVPLLCP